MRILLFLIFALLPIFAQDKVYANLSLKKAIEIVKRDNLEIGISKFNEKIKSFEHKIAVGYNYGKLDLIQLAMRSNDASSVFGFKLASREADFNDFGFSEFISQMDSLPGNKDQLLSTQPSNLNYPDARNFFQTKLKYELPIYTGGKLEQYGKITEALKRLSSLDTQKITSEKIFQLKKSYFNIYLLEDYISNLNTIRLNMEKLEDMARSMIEEGYAKKVDLLEVQTKKSNILRMLHQAKTNKELVYGFISFLLNAKVESISGSYKNINPKNLTLQAILDTNLDIKKAKLALNITNMNIKLQESANLPQVGAFAEYSTADDRAFDNFTNHDAYTFGMQLKWNLFNSGIDKNSLEKAKVENLKTKTKIALAKRGIILQVAKIKTEIENFDFAIFSLNKEVELSRAIYKNYFGRYQEKLISINDVIIKQSLEIEKILKLKEIENKRINKILELEKISNGVES